MVILCSPLPQAVDTPSMTEIRLRWLAMMLIHRRTEYIPSPEEISIHESLIWDNLEIKFELCSCWLCIIILCLWLKLLYASKCTRTHLRTPKYQNFLGENASRPPYTKGSLDSPRPPLTAIFSTLANISPLPPKIKSYVDLQPWLQLGAAAKVRK